MTTDLEKQFFDTFGIEPKTGIGLVKFKEPSYPTITDRILLELFDILRKYYNLDFWTSDDSFVMDVRDKQASYTNIIYRTGGDFKNSILRSLNLIVKDKLTSNEKIEHQVRKLF
jgi:hypothetical protein